MRTYEKAQEPLTPLEWFVYRLLMERTYGTDNRVSQREIYETAKAAGHDVTWNENPANHNCHCRWLTKVEERLTLSEEIDKMVGHDPKTYEYFICTKEQAEKKIEKFDLKIRQTAIDKSIVERKIRRDQQGKLHSNAGVPMDGTSKGKEFHEAFNEIKEID